MKYAYIYFLNQCVAFDIKKSLIRRTRLENIQQINYKFVEINIQRLKPIFL